MAILIIINFIINVVESEVHSPDAQTLNAYWVVDLIITIIYCLELILEIFVKFWRPFIQDGWCLLDLFCVLFSLIGIITDSSVQVVRLVRILRVVRIFRFSRSLQRILSAIFQCIAPLCQTLLLIMVVIAIYAVVVCHLLPLITPVDLHNIF